VVMKKAVKLRRSLFGKLSKLNIPASRAITGAFDYQPTYQAHLSKRGHMAVRIGTK
jgi:hypothetical protein